MKKVVIVGVGALGSHVLQFARNIDSSFRIIDFDRVEQKNVASQFHGKPSVSTLKVAGLKQSMQFLFGLKVETISNKLVENNVEQLLGGQDLVLDCLDNGTARRVVQNFIRRASIPCLHGALDANGSFGCITWDEHFVIDDEPGQGAATCEDGEHLPFIATSAALLARAAQEFLKSGRKIGFLLNPGGAVRT